MIIDTDENVYDAIPSASAYALELGTRSTAGGKVPEARLDRRGRADRGLADPLPDRRGDQREAPAEAGVPGLEGPAEIELDI